MYLVVGSKQTASQVDGEDMATVLGKTTRPCSQSCERPAFVSAIKAKTWLLDKKKASLSVKHSTNPRPTKPSLLKFCFAQKWVLSLTEPVS